MTATITDHAALLRDMAEQAYWVLRQLQETAPDGHTVAVEVSAPLGLMSRFAAEVAALIAGGDTYQPASHRPDPAPIPTMYAFTDGQLTAIRRNAFAAGFDFDTQLPAA